MEEFAIPLAHIGDIAIEYERLGRAGHGRTPLLLINGIGGGRIQWPPQFLELLTADFELISFDNRGTGGSSKPARAWSMADFADDTLGLIDALELRRVHLLGLSMGGMIAQEVTLRAPRRIDHLILADTHAGRKTAVPSAPWVEEAFAIDAELSAQAQAEKSRPAVYSERFIARHSGWLDQRLADTMAQHSPISTWVHHAAAIKSWDSFERLPRIKPPTLVVHGAEDVLILPENGRVLATQIPDARFELIEGSGHIPMAEQPRKTVELIRNFLQDDA
jgi:3-oxoadipate enol-lactonase